MNGRATACAAGTVINAITTWKGSAFAVDLRTEANVELNDTGEIRGEVLDRPITPDLIENTAKRILERYSQDPDTGANVTTRSDVPPSSGMKSSSAAANATALATLHALDLHDDIDPIEVIRIGVEAAVETGVTITGAFDDAAASYLGGLVFTDNRAREMLEHRDTQGEALFYVPDEEAASQDADVDRASLLKDLVEDAFRMARRGDVEKALTMNGVLHCATLGFDPEPALLALEAGAKAAGLSGTGPSFTALPGENGDAVQDAWSHLPGTIIRTETDNEGARIEEA